MLKICDNVDLEELEKYGYEYESVLEVYYKMIIPKEFLFFLFNYRPKARVITITKEREIITRKMDTWLDWNICKTNEKDIKKLIKDGLVEKEMINGKRKRVKKIQAIKQCYLRCLSCNNIQTIYRRKAKLRQMGHFKHIYCYKCKKRTKHIEFDNNDKYSN